MQSYRPGFYPVHTEYNPGEKVAEARSNQAPASHHPPPLLAVPVGHIRHPPAQATWLITANLAHHLIDERQNIIILVVTALVATSDAERRLTELSPERRSLVIFKSQANPLPGSPLFS